MNKKAKEGRRLDSRRADSLKTVASSLISILIGIIFGGVLLFIVSLFNSDTMSPATAWEGFRIVLAGIFNTGRDLDAGGVLTFGFNSRLFGDMLFRATPLIMTGLSVALAYKTGLFNIGAPGQYLMGTMSAIVVALSLDTSKIPAGLVWILAFLTAAVAGALWGCIPGFFKAFLNVNEVITSIMTNWIAANLVTIIFDNSKFRNMTDYGKVGYTLKLNSNGVASPKMGLDKLLGGSNANVGIVIAIVIAIFIYIMISKTTFGYELKACGSNKFAAKYAGMNEKRNIVLSMAIAGALSGIGAALYYLQGDIEFFWNTSMTLPNEGFNGIPVALLAICNPIGTVFAGLFMAYLTISGNQLSAFTPYNEYMASIIVAVIVYLSAFSLFFKGLLDKKKKRADKSSANDVKEVKAGEGEKQ
ncbi:MAG: ABC transporter permease [Clostridium sp.]|nr:ABC transporter permease [Clostridium sp.]MDY5895791.1 ABC transporter permease [Oscillospiraceae bacterium]